MSSVAFCGADPGFKEATGLCSGLEAADPTICHFGRDLVPPWSCAVGSKSTKTVLKRILNNQILSNFLPFKTSYIFP